MEEETKIDQYTPKHISQISDHEDNKEFPESKARSRAVMKFSRLIHPSDHTICRLRYPRNLKRERIISVNFDVHAHAGWIVIQRLGLRKKWYGGEDGDKKGLLLSERRKRNTYILPVYSCLSLYHKSWVPPLYVLMALYLIRVLPLTARVRNISPVVFSISPALRHPVHPIDLINQFISFAADCQGHPSWDLFEASSEQ